jgi:hypothetical protein
MRDDLEIMGFRVGWCGIVYRWLHTFWHKPADSLVRRAKTHHISTLYLTAKPSYRFFRST